MKCNEENKNEENERGGKVMYNIEQRRSQHTLQPETIFGYCEKHHTRARGDSLCLCQVIMEKK